MKHFTHFKSSILRGLLSLFFLTAMVSSAWGAEVTFSPSSDKTFPKDGITISVTDGTLTNGTDYRVYKNQTMTISSTVGNITNIELTYSNVSYDGGGWGSSYQPNATSWTSPTANGEQARITKIVITYSSSQGGNDSGETTPTKLSVPTDLSSSNVTTTTATLSWNTVENASSYKVKIGTTEYDASTNSYSATGLTEGTQYTWSVKAIGDEINYSSSDYATSANFTTTTPTFASLEKLVAADIAHNTTVTVSFENVPIKDIYTTQQGYRNGIYFDIQKDDKDIEIYYQNVPEEWVIGGTVSGTMTCPWKKYNGTWELAPNLGSWAWSNLTYNAPVVKTITALTISGSPTKTEYNAGESFDPTGLTVTATYNIGNPEVITTGYQWEIDYGTDKTALEAVMTSVDVMVYTESGVTSDVYTVTDLTVTTPVALTSIAISGTPSKTSYYVGDSFDPTGLTVTGTYSNGETAPITEGITWTFDPETMELGTSSVDVMASVESIVSDILTVNEITVTKAPYETVDYNFASFASAKDVVLSDLDGFTITLRGNGGTNPAWSSNQARVYAKGSLTVKANNATIKSIEYTYNINASSKGVTPTIDGVEGTTTSGSWDAETKTWTGSDSEVTFSTSGSAGNIGFTKLVIRYEQGSKTETSLAWNETEATVTMDASDNVFPTLTTTPADLEGVTYESSNTEVATIADDGTVTLKAPGNTTITASFAGNGEYAPATSASYTLTVNKAPIVLTPAAEGYESVDFTSIDPYKNLITNGTATIEEYIGSSFSMAFAKPQSSSNPTKYFQNGYAVRAYTGNTISITGAEDIAYVLINFVSGYADDAMTITGLGTTNAVVTFSKTCRFTSITVSYRSASLSLVAQNSVGYWATFSSNEDVAFIDAATTVYTVNVADGVMTFNEVANKQVPAGNGILLKTEEATATYVTIDLADAKLPNNMLKPGTGAKTEGNDCKFYRLAYNDYEAKEGLGFYYGAAEGAAFTCKAGGAYLAVPTSAGASEIRGFSFEDLKNGNETAIPEIDPTGEVPLIIYTMTGIRIPKVVEDGLYIVNGKTKWMLAE